MAETPVSRMCPSCGGRGIDGINILGADKICTKCGGKGTVIEFVRVPDSPRSQPTTSSGGGGEEAIGGLFVLALMIAAFLLLISLILIYALIKALIKIFSTEKNRANGLKLLIVIAFFGILYGIGILAVDPRYVFYVVNLEDIIPQIPYPWNYSFAILAIIPIGVLYWGEKNYHWLSASWKASKVLLLTIIDSIFEGWDFVEDIF